MNIPALPAPPPDTASSLALREIVSLARQSGIDADAALRDGDVDPALIENLAGYIPVAQFERVLSGLIRRSSDPLQPIRMASQARHGTFGIVSFIAMVAPTIADVIERAVQFERLLGDFASTRSETRAENVAMIWDCRLRDPAVHRAMTEGVLVAWVVYARWLLNDSDMAPVEVLFAHPAPTDPGHRELLERIFSAPVRFGQGVSGVVIPRALLAIPLRQPEPVLFQTLDSYARQRLAGAQAGTLSGANSVATRVALAIRQCIDEAGFPRKEAVAAKLDMNPRTMLRRLQEQQSTYQDVLDDVRKTLALELAKHSMLTPEEVAVRLGFGDIRSLQRCFRRWTGKTFVEYRRGD